MSSTSSVCRIVNFLSNQKQESAKDKNRNKDNVIVYNWRNNRETFAILKKFYFVCVSLKMTTINKWLFFLFSSFSLLCSQFSILGSLALEKLETYPFQGFYGRRKDKRRNYRIFDDSFLFMLQDHLRYSLALWANFIFLLLSFIVLDFRNLVGWKEQGFIFWQSFLKKYWLNFLLLFFYYLCEHLG